MDKVLIKIKQIIITQNLHNRVTLTGNKLIIIGYKALVTKIKITTTNNLLNLQIKILK